MNASGARTAFDEAAFAIPVPDSSVLSAGRRAPPVFPAGVLPSDLWRLAVDMADGCAAPVDYVACGMLATAAAAIGGTRKVQAYCGHKWVEPCVLWFGAVGDPSSGKSPAIESVIEPLRDIEREMASEYASTLRHWETDDLSAKCARDDWTAKVKDASKNGVGVPIMPECAIAPDKPCRPRLLVSDTTPEAMAAVLASNPRLLSYRDELAGWFQSFERYAPGGRTQWLEAFGGRPFVIDRKGADAPLVIPFNGVSVLGGIQPERLASIVLSGDNDGLGARFAWTWPRAVPYRRPRRIADQVLWPAILRRLAALQLGREDNETKAIVVPLDDEAANIFEAWRTINGKAADEGGALFKSFVGKLPGILLRIALVLELIEWSMIGGAEPTTVTAANLLSAQIMVDDYLKPMAMRVFGDAALSVVERNAATLARYILRTQAIVINLSEVRRIKRLPGLTTAEPLDEAAEALIEAQWLFPAGAREGGTKGRMSKSFTVNPAVHTMNHGDQE